MVISVIFRGILFAIYIQLIENTEERFRPAVIIKQQGSDIISEQVLIGYPSCLSNGKDQVINNTRIDKLESEMLRVSDRLNNISQKLEQKESLLVAMEVRVKELENKLNKTSYIGTTGGPGIEIKGSILSHFIRINSCD